MRLHILSDLHLEFGPIEHFAELQDGDVLVLAGDIHTGTEGIDWAVEAANGHPVIYVAGNHELYHADINAMHEALRERALSRGVHMLECGEAIIHGVRFLGATLWTDFKLNGDQEESMQRAARSMADFHLIRTAGRKLQPADTVIRHEDAVAWLVKHLSESDTAAVPTVVVTHHLPHPSSIADKYAGDDLNPAFCSDLSGVIERYQPRLWIHGHTHESCDYYVGKTRIVCNPRGYVGFEINSRFKADLFL